MSGTEPPVGPDDMHAFVDGQATPDRVAAVEAYLAAHPDAAAKVAADAAFLAALRARLHPKGVEPIPQRLRVGRIIAARRRQMRTRLFAVAASAAWLAIGVGAGWFGRAALQGPAPIRVEAEAATTREAMTAYRTFVVEKLHPVEVPAEQEAHLVQWLSRRLGQPLKAPDLTAQGYKLMGGRLLPSGTAPAAQFMYADAAGNRLTLYAHPGGIAGETGFQFAQQDGVSAFAWIDRDLSYVVTATTDRPHLLAVAEAVHHQLARSGG